MVTKKHTINYDNVWNDGIMERWNVGLRRHKSKTRECSFPCLPTFKPLFQYSTIPVFKSRSFSAKFITGAGLRPVRNALSLRAMGIMIIMTLMVACTCQESWSKPYIKKLGNRQWIANTTIKLTPQASALALTDTAAWCALTGGLGEYNLQNGRMAIYYMGDDDAAADITSLAAVDDTLWVATRKGIRLFNMRDHLFTSTLTSQNSPLGADNNISLTFDTADRMLYIMSFENMQRYDPKKKKWELLNYLYTDMAVGEPSANHLCVIGDEDIWIAGNAHASSKGGLFRYNRKEKDWSVYRDPLTGTKNPKRIDIDDMMLGPGKLFVLAQGRLARYDAKLNTWDISLPGDLESAGTSCAELFPHLQGHYMKGRDTVPGMLSKYLSPHIKIQDYQEIYFTDSRTAGLTPEALTMQEGDEPARTIRFVPSPLIFKKALGTDGISKVLFLTNHGLEMLETSTLELSPIKNSECLIEKSELCDYQPLWKDDYIFLVVRRMPDPDDDPAGRYARIYTIDTKKWQIQNRTPKEAKWIDELFVTKNNLYCYTDKSLMIWKGGMWIPTKERLQWSASPLPPPSHRAVYTLKNGKKVEFTPRGIMVY